jgi:hypothetical protein
LVRDARRSTVETVSVMAGKDRYGGATRRERD